jgi:glycosyltransferase involved in cell wall biosynthesis
MSQECKTTPTNVGQRDRDIPLVGALLIELRPVSVSYRHYRERVSGKTLLEHCVEKLSSLQFGSPTPCVIAVYSEAERDLVAAISKNLPLETITLRATDLLQAAEEICSIARAANVLLLSLEHIFAPHDLAAQAADCHLARQSGITFVSGLPEKVTPVVIQCKFAAQLRSSGLPLSPLGLHQLPRALDQLRESSQDPMLAPVNRIQAEELYPKLDTAFIPAAINLEFSREIAWADAALRNAQGQDGFVLLRAYLAVQAKENATASAQRFSAAGPERLAGKIRALYISSRAGYSGAEESLCQLIHHMQDIEKHALVSLEGRLTSRLREAGANVICPNHEFSELSVDNFDFLLNLLDTLKPDIVHLNGQEGFPILAATSARRIPVVLHVRNSAIEGYDMYIRAARHAIAVSRFVQANVLRAGMAQEHVTVIYDEVDCRAFRPGAIGKREARERLRVPLDVQLIAMIARYAPYKRHDVMLRAFARLRIRVPHVRLLIVGESYGVSDYCAHVRGLADLLELGDYVTFAPFLEDIRIVHEAADVVVLCSDGEALGRCIPEAMAMEVPVVVTNSGGTREIVANRETGMVVTTSDDVAVAEAIEQLLTDRALYGHCAGNARRYVVEHLSAESSARKVAQIYSGIALRRNSGDAAQHTASHRMEQMEIRIENR